MTFLGVASTLAERVPRGHSALADQLRRAALSVSLNIAEGSGKGTMEDREARRFYAIARGSALECAAIVDALGGGVLPCAAFGANAAWFRLCLVTYNLLSAMKVLALPPPFEDARPKRLRFAVFNLPARLVSHARRLLARVGRSLLERADLLLGRTRLRAAHAA